MDPKKSDKELINELTLRFEKNNALLKEQHSLLNELQKVNKKLIASEGLKSNFLSNIRNEINNPVASILELSKNISEGTLSVDAVKKFASLIYSETFSLDFQLRNIFASAEIEAGESIVCPVSIKLPSLIETILLSFKHQIEKKNIQIFVSTSIADDENFCSDPEKLHLILSNLISNAVQFSREGTSIEIKFEIENDQFIFSVLDNGMGISTEEKEIIFDRFRQIEEGSTKNYGGHGLGLSITRALLELIDGEIKVESEKNVGSFFSICVNEAKESTIEKDIYSTDGNDFIFVDNDSLVF
ncbi:sensor histidine kinase [Aurantibacillus circumpalustris]|uniref:sensor histidine kinase n=1 Tax=Aurantibacillus circumpalustris TaxID=3036359 RepID=UPI00295A93B3|nr:HAMP domain-containing sensor histidine kinase [Aurantibacillus circumpalustris]